MVSGIIPKYTAQLSAHGEYVEQHPEDNAAEKEKHPTMNGPETNRKEPDKIGRWRQAVRGNASADDRTQHQLSRHAMNRSSIG